MLLINAGHQFDSINVFIRLMFLIDVEQEFLSIVAIVDIIHSCS